MALVAMPIYAQDVYFDENYIVVPEDAAAENLDEEDVVVNDEFDYGVDEDGITLEAIEEEPVLPVEDGIERTTDEWMPAFDSSDFGEISGVTLGSSSNANRLV
ncbi:hypothetical protein IJL65_01045 [bacterium]|nr:hypothetical protein [bacterium]